MSRTIDFRYAPPVVQTCIGLVDDEQKTILREDGSLNYGYGAGETAPGVDQETLGFRHRLRPTFTHQDDLRDRTQTDGDPGAAIVTTTERYDETTFEWTAFAHRGGDCRADVLRWTLSAAEGFGRAPSEVVLEVDGPLSDLPEIRRHSTADGGPATGADETDLDADEAGAATPTLRGGDRREGVIAVVHSGDPGEVDVAWADDALAGAREYWAGVEPFRNRFRVPDESVQDLLTASARNILQAREEHDGVLEYQVGPTQYRGLWIVDGHFLLEAAHMMGRGADAFEQGLLALLRRVRPSGAIQNLAGNIKETGMAMATIVRQCELADDDDRLAELWPTMQRGLDFLRERHREAADLGADYPVPELFPPAFLDGGIGGPFPDFTTPLWVMAGVRQAAEAGRRLGLEGHEEFAAFHEEIRTGFEICADRHRRVTDDGVPYLPMNVEERPHDNPQSATYAFAHAIHPGEVFDPDSRYVEDLLALLDSVDDEQGIPANTGWIHDQGVWPYSAAFYANAFLYAGRPAKAVDYLYAFANHAAPSRVWREEQAVRDSHAARFVGDMPHNWASAEFIRLVRHLLAFERFGRLDLLAGLPAEWLPTEDDPLVVEATPTRYGPVDLRLERATDGDAYAFTYDRGPGNQDPESVRLYWRGTVPDHERVERVDDDAYRLDGDVHSLRLHDA